MSLWAFKCFTSENGRDLIDEWLEALPIKARAKFLIVIEHLRDNPHTAWVPFVEPLTGYEQIFEIKFRAARQVYRPLGCFGPSRHDFTVLIGAREHGDDFEPRQAPEIAEQRREVILRYQERAHECDF